MPFTKPIGKLNNDVKATVSMLGDGGIVLTQ